MRYGHYSGAALPRCPLECLGFPETARFEETEIFVNPGDQVTPPLSAGSSSIGVVSAVIEKAVASGENAVNGTRTGIAAAGKDGRRK